MCAGGRQDCLTVSAMLIWTCIQKANELELAIYGAVLGEDTLRTYQRMGFHKLGETELDFKTLW